MTLDTGYIDHLIGAAAGAGFVGYMAYRRFRRNFGRQPLRRRTLIFRLIFFSALTLFMASVSFRSAPAALAALAGLGAGVLVAFKSCGHTRFEKRGAELFYVPHTYAGIAVSVLFLGRLLYRMMVRMHSPASDPAAALAAMKGFGAAQGGPATLFMFCLLSGYYIYFYSYLLRKSSGPGPDDWEDTSPEVQGKPS